MEIPKNPRMVNRRTVLTAAAATLPSTVVLAAPAIILPRRGLAAAMQEHTDAIMETYTPFVLGRGTTQWTYSTGDAQRRGHGSLTLLYGERERLEVFTVKDGILDARLWSDLRGQGVYAYDTDYPL